MSASLKSYELFLILSSRISEDDRNSFFDKISELINKKGSISETNKLGKKRLAYPINKELEGFFANIKFSSESSVPSEIERIANITDGVLRSLVLSI